VSRDKQQLPQLHSWTGAVGREGEHRDVGDQANVVVMQSTTIFSHW